MAFTIKVQAVIPKPLNVGAIEKEVQSALTETGKILQAQFGKTVETWQMDRDIPQFAVETGIEANSAYVACYPTGQGEENWRRLDEGTEEHDIAAVNAPMLIYQSQFTPKTTPRQLSSQQGGKTGPYDVRRRQVHHPGTEPREWSRTLAEQEVGPFADRVQAAIDKGMASK